MPNIFQYSPDKVMEHVETMVEEGITSFILFGIPKTKDEIGSTASDPNGPVAQTVRLLKEAYGSKVTLYADVCLCEYTSHGHCGIIEEGGRISNDLTLPHLSKAALAYAEAGADWVAPSNMMDHRVSSLRDELDENGFKHTAILSYSAKFASNYYGPFRDAAESPPQFGDRKSYQIDFRSPSQAIREVIADEIQGADATMVKPALAYLDMIAHVRAQTRLPLYAYNVSGEYAMVKFGARQGLFEEKAMVLENLMAMRRAGADLIISYHAVDIAQHGWLP